MNGLCAQQAVLVMQPVPSILASPQLPPPTTTSM
jgi:hypothetical protein